MLAPALPVLMLSTALGGCQRGPAARLAEPPPYEPDGQSKCDVLPSPTRPLVVEWPAADRASLETRLKAGLVAVRAEGCTIEVLRRCTVPGSYAYHGLTRKSDEVVITNADELYAHLPIGAARLEGKLARSGKLDVRMALVGMLEAPSGHVTIDKLTGDCHGATHVIAGVQLGAFEFFAGGTGELGAGVGLGQAGAGGRSQATKELLSADGDPERCDASTTADSRPPEGCGAVIRIELAQLGAALPPASPTCPAGSHWDGSHCVITETHCPNGTQSIDGRCVEKAVTVATAPTAGSLGCPGGMKLEPGVGCVPPNPPGPATNEEKAQCSAWCDRYSHCDDEWFPKTYGPRPEDVKREYRATCQTSCELAIVDSTKRRVWAQCFSETCHNLIQCFWELERNALR